MTADGLREPVRVRVVQDDRSAVLEPEAPSRPPADYRTRVFLCVALFGVVFVALAARLTMVSFGMTSEPRVASFDRDVPVRPAVFDRSGRPLILNREAMGIAIHGRDVWDVDEAVDTLVEMFPNVDAARLRDRLDQKRYTMVATSISRAQKQAAIATGLPGLVFPATVERAYPQRDLASHVVGYTIAGRGGVTGVERALDREAFAGKDGGVRITIDLVAQQILEDELAAAMQLHSAPAAWGVLLHAPTGEVRALASLPDYNPNLPGAAVTGAWRNRAMTDVYELGSALKPITVAMALDAGVVSVDDTFDVAKPMMVGGWPIKDYSLKPYPLTLSEVVQYSSNIGTVQVAQRLGKDSFLAGYTAMGLLSALPTELPEQARPLLPARWGEAELATAAYGHGFATTPLQLTAAFAAVVNGGELRTPTFQPGKVSDAERVISAQTSAQMRQILRKSVTEGTGKNAEAAGYYPIGKTATADKPKNGEYTEDGKLVSSFIGAFPGYAPEYVLLVSLDEPEGIARTNMHATAGHVAAPIFRRVVERVAPPLGLMPVADDVALDGFVGLRRETAEMAVPSVEDVLGNIPLQGAN